MVLVLAKAARPHQWVKNLFVLAPLIFARRTHDPVALFHAGLALGCFCLLSSAVYLINDVIDADKDRAHPLKRFRPIAAGALPVQSAKAAALILAATALTASVALGVRFSAIGAAYLGLNLGYSLGGKRIAFVDVSCISLGFLFRVLGGAVAIPVPASGWLLGCTLLLSAFLGFGKRAHELRLAGDRQGGGGQQRDVLEKYSLRTLNNLLAAFAVLTIAAYGAYTQSEHGLKFFGTRSFGLTIPFVAFGIFRFLWITTKKADAESPTESMLRDKPFVVNLILYAVSIAVAYGGLQ